MSGVAHAKHRAAESCTARLRVVTFICAWKSQRNVLCRTTSERDSLPRLDVAGTPDGYSSRKASTGFTRVARRAGT